MEERQMKMMVRSESRSIILHMYLVAAERQIDMLLALRLLLAAVQV
jgi:hypothetical protein